MDDEMMDAVTEAFVAYEIDLDYEFDAARYFDFAREESPAEARQAELWFHSAGSYPPSPFVAKLVLRDNILLENVNISPKSKDVENTTLLDCDSDNGQGPELSVMDVTDKDCNGLAGGIFTNLQSCSLPKIRSQLQILPTGLTFYDHPIKDNPKAKTKSAVKTCFPRSSTLMKPTASHLAKQNPPHPVGDSRFQTLLVHSNERSLNNSFGIEGQAAKRQKLEGGHLRKVVDTKQQINLVHKAPKKDGTSNGNSAFAKLKLTIPREPDLETAHRAQRIRPKIVTDQEHVTSTVYGFKARPLNRKILEAPSLLLPKKSTPRLPEFQVFHLKTSERAMQHASAVSSSSLHCNNFDKGLLKPTTNSRVESGDRDTKRPISVDAPKQDGCDLMLKFKARPLNKKIFSSKGDIGVFRNSKRETTVPMEFNFHTQKSIQHNPPIELFNKLSLSSEPQADTGSPLKVPWPTCIPTKGSKENRLGFLQRELEIIQSVKEKPPVFGGKQIQCGNNGGVTQIGVQSGMNRSMGIR